MNNKDSKNLEIPFENNILNWRVKKNNEFYIDFETYDIKNFEKTQKIVRILDLVPVPNARKRYFTFS